MTKQTMRAANMSKSYPYESPEGFYEIPNFSQYAIARDGRVFSKHTGRLLKVALTDTGYLNVSMRCDGGDVIGRHRHHRIVAFAFVPLPPGGDPDVLHINHINGIKHDNRPENLEWVTCSENVRHAWEMGNTPDAIPVSVLDLITGEILKFDSIWSCHAACQETGKRELQHLKYTTLKMRVRRGDHIIYPEQRQYREGHDDRPWPKIGETAKLFLPVRYAGTEKAVQVRFVLTGEVQTFKKLIDVAEFLNIAPSTLSIRMNRPGQLVFLPNFHQLKWASDLTPWREVSDVYLEIRKSGCARPVVATNIATGQRQIFTSCVECAATLNLLPTTLNFRLRDDEGKAYNGYRFDYYERLVNQPDP